MFNFERLWLCTHDLLMSNATSITTSFVIAIVMWTSATITNLNTLLVVSYQADFSGNTKGKICWYKIIMTPDMQTVTSAGNPSVLNTKKLRSLKTIATISLGKGEWKERQHSTQSKNLKILHKTAQCWPAKIC